MVSLEKIAINEKILLLAYDQGLEHGPTDFNEHNADPNFILELAVKSGCSGVVFQKGIADKYYKGSIYQDTMPLVLKLNGKTNLVKDQDPYSPLLCTVDEAVSLGAKAVGYTIYVGSEFESKMTAEFSEVVRDAHAKSMPVVVWMYIRGKAVEGTLHQAHGREKLSSYAARMGLELGADVIKMYYPGDLESLSKVVDAAGKTKVIVSGGEKMEESAFLEFARLVMTAGAAGMAVGRNVWQRENALEVAKKLKQIIYAS